MAERLCRECGLTCDDVYTRGVDPDGCTDCGLGTMGQVQPGASSDIVWGSRVYTPYAYSAACGPVAYAGQMCEEGHSLADDWLDGEVRICNGQNDAFCLNGRDVTFTIDTTEAEGAIELN